MKWDEGDGIEQHDDGNIKGFFGEYKWLSNFHGCDIEYQGLRFQSTEAAYQAAKCRHSYDRQQFTGVNASKAKRMGRQITIREDWDEVKFSIMLELCTYKFSRNSELRKKLLETGNKYIEETNWWGDTYWGVCNGKGENKLGQILMIIRSNLSLNDSAEQLDLFKDEED